MSRTARTVSETAVFLQGLRESLAQSEVLTEEAATPYLCDASSAIPGIPIAVVLAGSATDVASALGWAHAHRIPVIPRGAGTGVSGGATAISGGLVISTERMNSILSIRPEDRLAVVEPGVIVDDLESAARKHGLMYAPDPASSASATIGGTIATNAGGLRCLSHGVTSDHVAALQVALADGRLLRTGSESRKNVAGYDLTRLFVGSEGTLGIVTEATVRLVPVPVGRSATFQVSFASARQAGEAVGAIMASHITPEVLELIDGTTARIIESYSPSGLNTSAAATLVGQVIDSRVDDLLTQWSRMLAKTGGTDFIWSASDTFLTARRLAFPALAARGMGVTYLASDAAVPPSKLGKMLEGIEALEVGSNRQISVVAHAGDGNIHAAINATSDDPADIERAALVVEQIARLAVDLGGTVTGEHGIGSLKRNLLELSQDETARAVHQQIKRALDPCRILNPQRAIW